MDSFKYDFAVIGGDLRSVLMAELLCKKGFGVIVYGTALDIRGGAAVAGSLNEALSGAQVVIGPIPLSKDGKKVSGGAEQKEITMKALEDGLMEGQILFAGCIPESFLECGKRKSLELFDFMEMEELAVFNSIATAEGAVAEAIIRHPGNLHGSRCLVLGYGKCGKTLAHKLAGLSCHVTVCARKPGAGAEAEAMGYGSVDFANIKKELGISSYIFNTVPGLVLWGELLEEVDKNALIIDIASAPGGVDYRAAAEQGITAFLCPGLPGKYAPGASAEALAEIVVNWKEISHGIKG